FPVIKDLEVDRSSLDRIVEAGGYVSVKTGSAPDANATAVDKSVSDTAIDYDTFIGCRYCLADCPSFSASLYTGAKLAHLNRLPQREPERKRRTVAMVEQMDEEGFGDCSNYAECEAVCPKGISISGIAEMRRNYMKATLSGVEA